MDPFIIMIINADLNKTHTELVVNEEFRRLFHQGGIVTSVLIINASDDPANERYVNMKKKELDKYNVRCYIKKFNERCINYDIMEYIRDHQEDFTAVMIQDPLYSHLNYDKIMSVVDPAKDIDGLHPLNQGKIQIGDGTGIIPCTALGVSNMLMLNYINLNGKNVVIVGRGKLVADPLSKMLERDNATVTKIHTKTDPEYAKKLIKNAHIIIPCTGRDLGDMINPETVGRQLQAIIGVGFRYENSKQLQDFDMNADWGTDVKVTSNTNATGTATICALIENLYKIKMGDR